MLYRLLRLTANLILLLGLVLILAGLGGSARQVFAALAELRSAFAPPARMPVEAQAAGPPPVPASGGDAVDQAAWEEFDPAIFDQDHTGFLPVTAESGGGQAPALNLLPAETRPAADPPAPEATQTPQVVVVEPQPEFPRFPTRLVIPAIDLDAPVVAVFPHKARYAGRAYDQWQAPQEFAAGFHESSAWLGQAGNTVLNGHHNIYGKVFARLVDLAPRDEIIVYGEDKPYHYQVNQMMILEERGASLAQRAENARWILPSGDERLTLVTCWPAESNTHRLVVVATRTR